jgi:hypothetical protein
MTREPAPDTAPGVNVEDLAEATTIKEILAAANVTWSSADNRGRDRNGPETRESRT